MIKVKRFIGVLVLAMGLLVGILAGLMMIQQPALAAPALAGEDGTRDVITPTNLLDSGVTMTLGAASGDGHKFVNNNREFIVATNDYTASVTLTIVTGGQVGGHDIDDVDVTIAAGATKLIGPFQTSVFNQISGSDAGRIYLNWNAAVTGTVASSVTLAVYRMQN